MEVKLPNQHTALLIAINRGKTPIIELLVTKGTVPACLREESQLLCVGCLPLLLISS